MVAALQELSINMNLPVIIGVTVSKVILTLTRMKQSGGMISYSKKKRVVMHHLEKFLYYPGLILIVRVMAG